MKPPVLFLATACFLALVAGHGDDGAPGLCGAPVPAEYTLSTAAMLLLIALALIGVIVFLALRGSRRLHPFKSYAPLALLLPLACAGYYAFLTPGYNAVIAPMGVAGSVHYHANLLVVINGAPLNLSQEKYMSTLQSPKSELTHLHDGDGSVIHYHAPNVPLWYFFHSIGIQLNQTCLTADTVPYCNEPGRSLQLFVDGTPVSDIPGFVSHDKHATASEDSLLLWFGSNDSRAIAEALSRNANHACWYDETCILPAGKTLPPESCSGG